MKLVKLALVLGFVVFLMNFTVKAASQDEWQGYSGFPMGSREKVMQYCVTNIQILGVYLYQEGVTRLIKKDVGSTPKFSSFSQLNSYFQEKLLITAEGALTKEDPEINRDHPFELWSQTARYDPDLNDRVYFLQSSHNFTLKKHGDSYLLPDLSGASLDFNYSVAYKFKNLKWARVEIYMEGWEYPYQVYDPNIDPSHYSVVRTDIGYLDIPTEFLTDEDFTVRITTLSGDNNVYQVFDDGEPVAEKPFYIANLKCDKEKVISFEIHGGEVGRLIQVMQSSSPVGPWEDVPGAEFVVGQYQPKTFTAATPGTRFYKLRAAGFNH